DRVVPRGDQRPGRHTGAVDVRGLAPEHTHPLGVARDARNHIAVRLTDAEGRVAARQPPVFQGFETQPGARSRPGSTAPRRQARGAGEATSQVIEHGAEPHGNLLRDCGLLWNGGGDPSGAQTGRRGGARPGAGLLGGKDPTGHLLQSGDQSSFRIVPMPRFLVISELPLLPNRSTKNVSSHSFLPSPITLIVMVLDVSPGAKVRVPVLAM